VADPFSAPAPDPAAQAPYETAEPVAPDTYETAAPVPDPAATPDAFEAAPVPDPAAHPPYEPPPAVDAPAPSPPLEAPADTLTVEASTPIPTSDRRRLGDVVVDLGFATRETVEEVALRALADEKPVGQALLEAGAIDARQLAQALAERNGLQYVDLNEFEVDKGAANLVSAGEARRYRAIPIAFLDEGTLLVACAEPENVIGLDDVKLATGYDVRPAVSPPEDIEALIGQLSRLSDSVHAVEEEVEEEDEGVVIELRESAEEAPVVKLVHSVIADAVERGASDVHFEPRGDDMRVRFRVDGVTFDSTTVPRKLAAGFISRVKIMAELDIAERRLPQDGRIGLTVDKRYIDLRVATLPVVRGEAVVMRILDKDRVIIDLDELGMAERDRETVRSSIAAIQGAVLVTGPTGAGKTTTLYAALSEVNTPDRTLIAIEDPVEYELEGIKQVQVNPKAGLTFATGLRSMVRADPDVLMVGEIRDGETAQIAIESALTGHLVLSTLHTNDATMAPARLIDMGIEPFLIASGLQCVVAQRLARRLCEECREPTQVTAEELHQSGFAYDGDGFEAYQPGGCVRCGGSGYRGRVGLYEVLELTDDIRHLILQKASARDIGEAAAGMRRLKEDGLEKARAGVTTVAEVLRVVGS
jgi:type IV pilus assembly protein PilB